ncbi:hypothetical protein ACXX84_03615 [Mycoplasma sp. AC157]
MFKKNKQKKVRTWEDDFWDFQKSINFFRNIVIICLFLLFFKFLDIWTSWFFIMKNQATISLWMAMFIFSIWYFFTSYKTLKKPFYIFRIITHIVIFSFSLSMIILYMNYFDRISNVNPILIYLQRMLNLWGEWLFWILMILIIFPTSLISYLKLKKIKIDHPEWKNLGKRKISEKTANGIEIITLDGVKYYKPEEFDEVWKEYKILPSDIQDLTKERLIKVQELLTNKETIIDGNKFKIFDMKNSVIPTEAFDRIRNRIHYKLMDTKKNIEDYKEKNPSINQEWMREILIELLKCIDLSE